MATAAFFDFWSKNRRLFFQNILKGVRHNGLPPRLARTKTIFKYNRQYLPLAFEN